MARGSRGSARRVRIGGVSVFRHHGAWWLYYREAGRPVRKRISADPQEARAAAARVHAQLSSGERTFLAFQPITIAELQRRFLDHHEQARGSTLATVDRYRAATQHLVSYAATLAKPLLAHQIDPDRFAQHLHMIEVAPNGHPHAAKRRLRDAGRRFVLETARSLYHFAARKRYLPPGMENPFRDLPIDRLRVEDVRPVFVFDATTEVAFLRSASPWAFPIHFTLGKTGLRIGELTHLLIEDVDPAGGWLTVRNRPELHWRVKTGHGRRVPLLPEVAEVLRRVIGDRPAGLIFRREGCAVRPPVLAGGYAEWLAAFRQRCERSGSGNDRRAEQRVARGVWQDAGLIPSDRIRTSFCRIMRAIGHPQATCPKSWRHTFATLLQDANVDPLIRQLVLGHSTRSAGGLGMTARYTHSRPETIRRQIEAALRQWPESLAIAATMAREDAGS